MNSGLILLATSFWLGAVHAATPGHGKTIAAAYIVGARGKPIDALVLGVFVTLSHTSGIVLVGVLASLGLPHLMPQRMEAYLALATGILVIVIGLWTLWQQREMVLALQMPAEQAKDRDRVLAYRPIAYAHVHPAAHAHHHDGPHSHAHSHDRDREHAHADEHAHDQESAGWHSHGWGFKHTHDLRLVTTNRPSLWVLLGLGIAGGLLPDPAALGILLNALAQGKVMLGLGTVLVFSIGFAFTLVVVGVIAAQVGRKVLDWLSGPWAMRLQVGTSLIIVLVGVILTYNASRTLATLA